MKQQEGTAYGSNLKWERMVQCCPEAQVIGSAVIPGYRLLFGQSMTGACATIAQGANCCVHAPVCRIPAEDEAPFDDKVASIRR